jgi:hypothetical protein
MLAICSAHLILFDLITLITLVKRTNYEFTHITTRHPNKGDSNVLRNVVILPQYYMSLRTIRCRLESSSPSLRLHFVPP